MKIKKIILNLIFKNSRMINANSNLYLNVTNIEKHKIESNLDIFSILNDISSDNINLYNHFKNNIVLEEKETLKSELTDFEDLIKNIFHNIWMLNKHQIQYSDKIYIKIIENYNSIKYLLWKNDTNIESYLSYFNNIHILVEGYIEIIKEYVYEDSLLTSIQNKEFEIQSYNYFDSEYKNKELELSILFPKIESDTMFLKNQYEIINTLTNTNQYNLNNFNFINELERNKIEKMVDFIAKNYNESYKYTISINALYLLKYQFALIIKEYLDKYKIKESSIVFELDEFSLIDDFQLLNSNIEKLKSLWYSFACKNYPENKNSLKQIASITNLDYIKIDISSLYSYFIKDEIYEDQNWLFYVNNAIENNTIYIDRILQDNNLESFVISLKFLKILNPWLTLFATNIDEKQHVSFVKSIGLFDKYQWFELSQPITLKSFVKTNEIRTKIWNGLLLFKNDTPESKPVKEIIKDLYTSLDYKEIFEDKYSTHVANTLQSFLSLLNFDCLTIYIKYDNIIYSKKITDQGNISQETIIFDINKKRIDKKYINLYRLLLWKPILNIEWFNIANKGVSEEGDDMVIQIYDNVYLGFDNTKIAISNLSPLHWFSTLFLAKIIKLNIEKFYKNNN